MKRLNRLSACYRRWGRRRDDNVLVFNANSVCWLSSCQVPERPSSGSRSVRLGSRDGGQVSVTVSFCGRESSAAMIGPDRLVEQHSNSIITAAEQVAGTARTNGHEKEDDAHFFPAETRVAGVHVLRHWERLFRLSAASAEAVGCCR